MIMSPRKGKKHMGRLLCSTSTAFVTNRSHWFNRNGLWEGFSLHGISVTTVRSQFSRPLTLTCFDSCIYVLCLFLTTEWTWLNILAAAIVVQLDLKFGVCQTFMFSIASTHYSIQKKTGKLHVKMLTKSMLGHVCIYILTESNLNFLSSFQL